MSSSDYSALFRLQLRRSLDYIDLQLDHYTHSSAPHTLLEIALQTLEFALEAPDLWALTFPIVQRLTPTIEHLGLNSQWIQYLTKGIHLAEEVEDLLGCATLQVCLGMAELGQGNILRAKSLFEKSLRIFDEYGNVEGMTQALNGLARTAHSIGDHQVAITFAYRALHLADDVSLSERATSYRILGMIAFSQRDWPEALSFFEQDLALWRLQGHKRHIGFGLVNVGSVLSVLRRTTEAVTQYQEAITIFKEENDKINIAAAQLNLGNVYLEVEDYASALQVYMEADWTLREANDALRLARLYNNMGMAYTHLENWGQAEVYYQKSIVRWRALGNLQSQVNTLDNLGEMHFKRGDIVLAHAVFTEAWALVRTIQNDRLVQMVQAHLEMTKPG